MGQIKRPVHSDGEVNAGEKRLVRYLETKLPDNYYVIPNGEYAMKTPQGVVQYYEYDCIVVAPHAIYHIENKDWAAQLTGDDEAWFVGGEERRNPHKTATYKSKILNGKLVKKNPDWQRARIITLVSLSHPNQSKFGLDPQSACFDQTFLLTGDTLKDFIMDAERAHKNEDAIADIALPITEYLTGTSTQREHRTRTRILNTYRIVEELETNEEYSEYKCVPVFSQDRFYKVREYPLDVVGKSPMQLEVMRQRLMNGWMAQEKIVTSPYIIKSTYQMNAEGTYLYEITDFMDNFTLKARMHNKTFTLMEKVKIIVDIAHGLKAAHDAGVFHRNVTPESICLLSDGNAALTNFSKSWFVGHTEGQNGGFTVKSQILKDDSPYCPPEFSDDDVCAASDLFSLGVVLYELMTGKKPFESTLRFKLEGGKLPESKLPTRLLPDLPEWVDRVVEQTITTNPEERFATAKELIDFISQKAFNQPSGSTRPATQKSLKDMKPGDNITPAVVLYEELGKGGYGRVFKAKNTITGKFFAVKIFDCHPSAIEDTKNEYNALSEINHPNVVKIHVCDITQDGLFYTQMELLNGENLRAYSQGDLRLPLPEIYKMATQVLGALVYMQEKEPPIFHRDIKPNNIVWDNSNRYVLIDFNIATSVSDNLFAGTQPYMAPDLVKSADKIEWDKSADTFSLGVTIYELLTHVYPWPGSDPCPRKNIPATPIQNNTTLKLSEQFSDFVMKSIITDSKRRFTSAREMLEALQNIGVDGMLKKQGVSVITNRGETDIVDYINSLYSQSEHGNSGTRASINPSPLDSITYTETKLDKRLLNDIEQLKYKLVIITGNAGDGKTAFLHKVETIDPQRETLSNSNGAKFHIKGVPFESNYDGSQDEEEKANDQVLKDFFKPFFGLSDYNQSTEGRVIAINEGRLVDFLSTQPALKNLYDNIEEYFYQEGHVDLLPGLMVINLNLRSVTAHNDEEESLLRSQIKKLTLPELWAKCDGCPIAEKCFIKYNVDTMNDTSAGDEVIKRLEWLIRTIVYKRELHITMRDLRSFVAFMLTRDYNCDQVRQMIEHIKADNIAPEFYWQFYYFNITAPAFYYKGYFPYSTNESNDRLIKQLKETDIARVAMPSLDRDLYYTTKDEEQYLMFGTRKQSLLDEFNKQSILRPYYDLSPDDVFIIKERHASMARHQYFEGKFRENGFLRRLPYQSIEEFNKELTKPDIEELDKCKEKIAIAISKSEGCRNEELSRRFMMLSCSHVSDPISRSYRMFSLDEFELFVNETKHLIKYIEYESDSLTFRHKTEHDIQLTVSLDLFEMLDYIGKGFNPSINDLQGRFIELQIFKNRLESKTYNEILVTKNNKKFSVIRLNADKTISIEPYKQVAQ